MIVIPFTIIAVIALAAVLAAVVTALDRPTRQQAAGKLVTPEDLRKQGARL